MRKLMAAWIRLTLACIPAIFILAFVLPVRSDVGSVGNGGGFTGGAINNPLLVPDGTKALPGLSFALETSSGLYRAGAGDVRFSVLNTDTTIWTTTLFTSPRLKSAGTVPTSCTSTGLGTGSAAIDTGSTDTAGGCTLSPTGAPAGTGVITLTFSSSFGTTTNRCVFMAVNGTGTWDGQPGFVQSAQSLTAPTFTWKNGVTPTALAAGSTYKVNYLCVAN